MRCTVTVADLHIIRSLHGYACILCYCSIVERSRVESN